MKIGFALFIIFKNLLLSCKRDLIRELNHGGSLSSHNMVSCGIKLLRTLRIDLLEIHTFSLTFVFEKALSQLKSSDALLMRSSCEVAFSIELLSKLVSSLLYRFEDLALIPDMFSLEVTSYCCIFSKFSI